MSECKNCEPLWVANLTVGLYKCDDCGKMELGEPYTEAQLAPQQDSKPTPEKPCETCGEAQEQVDRYRRALKWAKETLEAQKPPVMSAEYSVIVGILHVLNLESKCVLCQGRGEVPEESGAWVPCPNGCTPAEEED